MLLVSMISKFRPRPWLLCAVLALGSLGGAFAAPATPAAKTTTTPIITLGKPTNFKASTSYNTGVRISWNASQDASYYDLYRGTVTDFTQATLRAHIRIVRFNDRQTTTGVKYYYWVIARAVDRTSNVAGPVTGIRCLAARFLKEPPNLLANANSVQSITCTIEGVPAVSCQWYKGGTMLKDGGNLSGTKTTTLTFSPLKVTDAGDRYFICIKNSGGVVNSRFVRVEVIRPPASAP